MDELLHHCLRELSFDGDLGCNVSRLNDFVAGFYAHSGRGVPQNFDLAFCSFIWSLVVQHPTVVVGLIPEGVTSEVWVAPQTSAKRKAKASGQEHVETQPAQLEPIPNAKATPLEDLVKVYGDRLRIAVEPQAIFAAITGSHIRSSRMSPMVYSALQIITRGRDEGVTVVQLGQRSKYDQKTCFYLIKQLTEMDLVAKVRRGGVGTHFCIHKYFYDRSPSWQAIREEENKAKEAETKVEAADVEDMDDDDYILRFSPIDSRHLSSLPLIKARLVKLLKACQNGIHASHNLLITLGFANPTKTDRRFFQSRIRELIQQGVIEKVIVPSNRKGSHGSSVKCFRLVSDDAGDAQNNDDAVIVQADDGKDDDIGGDESGVKANITIHKQIFDLLEDSGTAGMTLNELSSALGNFDKRTIELFLARAEKCQPPKHLADIGIAGLMETSGRERRHRYYTVAAYQKLVAAEQLDKSSAGYGEINISETGGFAECPDSLFYDKTTDLHKYEDTFHRVARIPTKGKAKKGFKNPILPDGSVKKGRPRKHPPKDEASTTEKKRKRDAEADVGDEQPATRKRGRQKKDQSAEPPAAAAPAEADSAPTPAPKRRGGQKRKVNATDDDQKDSAAKKPRTRAKGKKVSEPQAALAASPVEVASADMNVPMPEESVEQSISSLHPPQSALNVPSTSAPEDLLLPPVPEQHSPHLIVTDDVQTPPADGATATEPPMTPTASIMSPAVEQAIASEAARSVRKPATRGRANVSHLRRENEILRVIEEAGGIVNIQTKEFYDAHIALLETLSKAGEPTSAPVGTRTDKRTAGLTIDGLESKGKLKQLKTSVLSHTGIQKPANIVYLPSVTQEQLNAFLAELARGPQPSFTSSTSTVVKIQEAVNYGADASASTRVILPLQLLQLERPGEDKKERWSKNLDRANQLFAYDDDTIRNVLLTERTTHGQLYGFIVGKAARARALHLSILEAFESEQSPPTIIPSARILDFNYFSNESPLRLFTALVSALTPHNEELTEFFKTEEGKNTPMKDLPPSIHTHLQVGRSRARSRILDILVILRSLGLVTPLKPSTSEQPWLTCLPHGKHPTTFDVHPDEGWTPSTPHAAPTYWYFSTEAPVYLWSLSDEEPPYWKTVSVSTTENAREYWQSLKDASIDTYAPRVIISSNRPAGVPAPDLLAAKTLRRGVSWNADYVLTWHQMKFLERSIDVSRGEGALEEEGEEERAAKISRLCWVTSAPQKAVEEYLVLARTKLLKDRAKLIDHGRNKEAKRLKKMEDSKNALARKAEEAKANRQNQWTALLEKIYPGELGVAASRVERVHQRFMQAGSVKDLSKWEKELLDALRETDIATKQIFQVASKRPTFPRSMAFTANAMPSATVLSIKALIDQQQPLLDQGLYRRKPKNKKGKEKEAEEPQLTEEKKGSRRQRFQWNKEYDELARDASVIIRARCRSHPRLDWSALEQIFPAVPRNTVRQRLSNLRESPGNESYLRRLEDRWYSLWVKFRGTDALPDEYPDSPSNFDLVQHIEFLRHNVDKNALRVGFGQEKETITDIIPRDVDSLLKRYRVSEEAQAAPPWDFVWNAIVEEGREKRLLSQCFTTTATSMPHQQLQETDEGFLAEAALKMTMGSPPETYNCDNASALLRSVGEEPVAKATQRMLGKGVLSKSQRDPQKQRPGRQLKISDSNQNAMAGSIPRDTYQDAVALLESAHAAEEEWREWPLTATDGDTVALIHLVSEGLVEFKVDTSEAAAARPGLDWNSKRADDDQIETAISVKYDSASIFPNADTTMDWSEPLPDDGAAPVLEDDAESHGGTSTGAPACCRQAQKLDNAVVDCASCLERSWSAVKLSLSEEELAVAERLLADLRGRGKGGCTKVELLDMNVDRQLLPRVVQALADAEVPLVHWAGYTQLLLVSSEHISAWTVVVSHSPLTRVLPRRWLGIDGQKIGDYWQAALRAVMALVIFRPGISQAEIRWRLRSVYDRQEIVEVLEYLRTEGYVSLRKFSDGEEALPPDDREEATTFWFLGDRCWFQV